MNKLIKKYVCSFKNEAKYFAGRQISFLKIVQDHCSKGDEYIDVIKSQSNFNISRVEYLNINIDKKFNDYTSFTYWMYIREPPFREEKEKLKKKPTEINDRKHNDRIFMLQKKVTTEKPIKICGMKPYHG
jgi:hypothetical protein